MISSAAPLRLLVFEEQEMYRGLYPVILNDRRGICLLDAIALPSGEDFSESIRRYHPDVLLLSTLKLDMALIEHLGRIRREFCDMGVVAAFLVYNVENARTLRRMVTDARGGMALFYKQSLRRAAELQGIIRSVSGGQIIIDPCLSNPVFSDRSKNTPLSDLTERETEILALIASGHTNTAIAAILCIDIRTVRHHINNVYSKLKADYRLQNCHPRVTAARLYMEKTGELNVPLATG